MTLLGQRELPVRVVWWAAQDEKLADSLCVPLLG